MKIWSTVGEAAIGWLVESILGALLLAKDKLIPWLREAASLDKDIERLESEMRNVAVVLEAVKGMKIDNDPLACSLCDLKDELYDAEDVLDELDYYRIQEQMTRENSGNVTATASLGASQDTAPSSSFSIHQIGSYASKVLSKAVDATSRKRKREENYTATSQFSTRINHIAGKLRAGCSKVSENLKINGLKFPETSNQRGPSSSLTTSSYLLEPKVYGRDAEMESIIKLIMDNKSNDITVLPIVGNGGIGKTTLAQRVYNNPNIGSQFGVKIWVHVSDIFDVVRLTREILECVSNQRYEGTSNFNKLQQDLEKYMKPKRFLIVLDDVWDDVTRGDRWNNLLAPLRCNHVDPSQKDMTSNTIIVTTREPTVAQFCGTVGSINLEGLKDEDIWPLFKAYAFGNDKHDCNPNLQVLGKQIVRELKGNPLAAKTVGSLLGRNLTTDHWNSIIKNTDHWNSIIKNEEWKSLQNTDGIMHVLKLSYDHLPSHLQQCFSYCSLFPKGYSFSQAQLIQIWIAQGFVEKSSERLEQKGWEYLVELVNSGFFELVESKWSSSKDIVLHDLMHDLARMVSENECATIDGSECKKLAPSIRHLSIVTDSAYHEDQYGSISRNEEFEKKLLKVTSRSKLRTLVLIGQYDAHFFKSFQDAFKVAHHLRLLQITSTFADFDCFFSSLVNSTQLRYLKLDNKESHGALPLILSKCYQLQVLDIGLCGTPGEYHSGMDYEDEYSSNMTSETSMEIELEGERLLMGDTNDATSMEHVAKIASEVHKGPEPHHSLKHLRVSRYNGANTPTWLATSLTCLQTLHLEDCGEWRVFSLERLSLLRKLVLIKMRNATES